MPKVVNSVDLDKIALTAKEGKRDRSALRKKVALQGEWNLDQEKGYQFRAEMQYEKGNQMIEIDSPSYLGGNGNRLGPMAYCIAGMTSCFVSTFATVAAIDGVELTSLKVNAQCYINFAKTFDVADEPITEGLDILVKASGRNADMDRLEGLLKKAEERCPAIYSMTHVIKVNARLA
ncbi:MAG: OsmC family protein [Nitrososphaerota archaeon]|nr:OsmC family protein [Nitrososphaerota archaeon]MDG7023759.1 OsmC family protein [Nitrososphaerota archaeon]